MGSLPKIKPKQDFTLKTSLDHETLERAKEMERQRQAKNGLQTVRIDTQTTIIVEAGVNPETARESFISKLNECRKKYY